MVKPAKRLLNFGAMRVGDKPKEKTVRLVNRGRILTSFLVYIVPSSSVPALQQDGVLAVKPSSEISLAPGKECEVSVSFSPPDRVPQFSEEVSS